MQILFFLVVSCIGHEAHGFTAFPIARRLTSHRISWQSKFYPVSQFSQSMGCADQQWILNTRACRSKRFERRMRLNDYVDRESNSLKEDTVLLDVFKKYSGSTVLVAYRQHDRSCCISPDVDFFTANIFLNRERRE
jgi:hypothetical protein